MIMATPLRFRTLALALALAVVATSCTNEEPIATPTTGPDSSDTTTDSGSSETTAEPSRSTGTIQPPVEAEKLTSTFTKLTEPGVGGRITSLAFDPADPNRLFVGGDMLGIAVTNDFGDTWQSTTGLASWEIGDITASVSADGRIWTGSLSGPQASVDGISWSLSREGMPPLSDSTYTLATESVLIDPTNDSRLLAFNGNQRNWAAPGAYVNGEWSGDGSVWESIDSGLSWSRSSQIAAGGNIRAAAFSTDGTSIFAAVARRGVFVSTDGGASWAQSGAGLPHGNPYDVATHATDPLVAWVAMGDGPELNGKIVAGGIWKTIDGGAFWTAANDGLSIVSNATPANTGSFHQIVVAPSNPDRLYTSNVAPGQAAIYRSDDGGTSWIIIADGATSRPNPYQGALRAFDIAVHSTDPDRIAIGSDDTLLGSIDGGERWNDLTTREDTAGFFSGHGYSGLVSTDIVFNPDNPDDTILLGFDGGNFIQTIDGGMTWRRTVQDISAWGGGVEAAFSPTNADRIYVLLGQFSNFRGIGVSDNGGTTFRLVAGVDAGLPDVSNVDGGATGLAVLADGDTDIVFTVVGSTLFRSEDSGATYNTVPGVSDARDVAVSPNGNVFVSTDGGTLVSTDKGLGYNDAGSSPTGITTLYTSASEPGAVYGVAFRQGSGGMYRFDAGEWTQLFDDLYAHGVAIDPANPQNLAVVTTEPAFNDISSATGVYLSSNGGNSWNAVTGGLPMTRLRTAEFDPAQPDRLVVGTTGRGFYEISFAKALGE
jgi:hypothetical protein